MPDVGPAAAAQIDSVRHRGGASLSPSVRGFFEPRFGRSFSDVRVHTDGLAAASAKQVNALAYTVGWDIIFGAGQYAPDTTGGRRLLAHELTHVLQQQGRNQGAEQPPALQRFGDPSKIPSTMTCQVANNSPGNVVTKVLFK
jgi:hypothetical protein